MSPEDSRGLMALVLGISVAVVLMFRGRMAGRTQHVVLLVGASVGATLCLASGDYGGAVIAIIPLAYCTYEYNKEWRRIRRLKGEERGNDGS